MRNPHHAALVALCAVSLILPARAESIARPFETTALDPRGKSVFMADAADGAAALTVQYPQYRPQRYGMDNWHLTNQVLSWEISVPADGDYVADLVAAGNFTVRLTGNANPLDASIRDFGGWNRYPLGVIHLKQGACTLRLELPQDLPRAVSLRELTLLPAAAKADYDRRVAASRASAAWMHGTGYGVMLQYGAWAYPPHGDKHPWEDVVNAFDVDKFAQMVDDMGARWVIWSITWRGSHFPMPLKSVDAIVPGHTTQRDLMADLIVALKKHNIKLMFYYHPGHEDKTFWAANWQDENHKDKFCRNWIAIMSEIGARYREGLAGIFVDCGLEYSPAPFESMTKAAKTGFPGRLVSYNDCNIPITDFQDIYMGEGYKGGGETADGIFTNGPHKGMQAHGMFCVNSDEWGIWQREQRTPLQVGADAAISIIKNANRRGQVMSLNFDMYEDATITPETMAMFRKLKSVIYALPPVSEGKPASASSQWAEQYGPANALDGDAGSFWSLAKGERSGWLDVDLGKPLSVCRAVIQEVCGAPRQPLVTRFTIEAQAADGSWKNVASGVGIGAKMELSFPVATARHYRLHILESKDSGGSAPVIGEFQLFEK